MQIHCTLRRPNWVVVLKGNVCLWTPGVAALMHDSAGSQLCLAYNTASSDFSLSPQPTVNFHNCKRKRLGRVLLMHKRHLLDLLPCQLVSELSARASWLGCINQSLSLFVHKDLQCLWLCFHLILHKYFFFDYECAPKRLNVDFLFHGS